MNRRWLIDLLREELTNYRCHYTIDIDTGEGIKLVDLLSPKSTIKEGILEAELLADEMASVIDQAIIANTAEEYGVLSDEIERRILAMIDNKEPHKFYDDVLSPFIREQLGSRKATRANTAENNGWMSLEDLPERACKVFFVDGVNEVHEGLFNPKKGFTSRGTHWKTSGLRAWMPRQQLPRPPKAEA